jgi:hypothetical protein
VSEQRQCYAALGKERRAKWIGSGTLILELLSGCLRAQAPQGPAFDKVFALNRDETVFAYARISPNGKQLLYARETRDATAKARVTQTVRLIDLVTGSATFEAAGVDAYWAPSGDRFIYQAIENDDRSVNIWNVRTRQILRDVAPPELGDYYSWGTREGRDLIVTINNYYYFLGQAKAELPAHVVPRCEDIGTGERPLLSKDGKRLTTFVKGAITVRNLVDCHDIIHTNMAGAKADFSWDGRYIAFHAPRLSGTGYEILVVDLVERTVRSVTSQLSGSSLFPSWTADGRVCFRYEGTDYNGFVMARHVLSASARPLPNELATRVSASWSSVFDSAATVPNSVSVVLIWSPWIAHAPSALADFQRASDHLRLANPDVEFLTAVAPSSNERNVKALLDRYGIALRRVAFRSKGFEMTDAVNQLPATLLFIGGRLVDRRLGAQTTAQLVEWIDSRGKIR